MSIRICFSILVSILFCITFRSAAQESKGFDPVIHDSIALRKWMNKLPALSRQSNLKQYGHALKHIADYYFKKDKGDSVVFYYEEARKIYSITKDSFNVAYCLTRLGEKSFMYDEATVLSFFQPAISYFERTKEYQMAAHSYHSLGNYYEGKNESLRWKYINKTAELNKLAKDTLLDIIILSDKVNWCIENNKADEIYNPAIKAISLSRKTNNKLFLKVHLYHLGTYYLAVKKYDSALHVLLESNRLLSYTAGKTTPDILRLISLCYIYLNDRTKAETYLTLYKNMVDSLLVKQQQEKYNELLLRYETEKKQAAFTLLQQQNTANKKLSANRQRWIIVLVISLLVLILVSIIAFKNIRKRIQLEKLYDLRSKISRDLHDEVGATLSSIQVYSSVAGKAMTKEPEKASDALHHIFENTTQAMENMNDIVWAINTQQTGNASLSGKLKNYGYEILTPRNISCIYKVDPETEKKLANIEARRNILLIAKEAMNNVARHSGASEMIIELTADDINMFLKLTDDGNGIPEQQRAGNGLLNMKKRTEALGGQFQITSEVQKGTTIFCSIPLTNISD